MGESSPRGDHFPHNSSPRTTKTDIEGWCVGTGVFLLLFIPAILFGGMIEVLRPLVFLSVVFGIVTAMMFDRWNKVTDGWGN